MGKLWQHMTAFLGIQIIPGMRFRRTVALCVILLVAWNFAGSIAVPTLISWLGRMDISLDGIFRAVPVTESSSLPTFPVTIVDIDEPTWIEWDRPSATPRDMLVRMASRAVDAGAVALVVDIDFSSELNRGNGLPDPFYRYLQLYPNDAPPIVLPKRVSVTQRGSYWMPSNYDEIVVTQSNVAWADATLDMDGDGVVRRWPLWREVCTQAGATLNLPSIRTRLAELVKSPAFDFPVLPSPEASNECREGRLVEHLRILFKPLPGGEPLTGHGSLRFLGDLTSVPARMVANDQAARDDAALFGNRIVFIGASHAAARDFHRTPYGDLPGVEVLAQQIHLAPLASVAMAPTGIGFRLGVGLLFTLLVVVDQFFRRMKTIIQIIVLVIAGFVGVQILQNLSTYEIIAHAVILMMALVGFRSVLRLVEDWTRSRSGQSSPESSVSAASNSVRREFLLNSRPWRD